VVREGAATTGAPAGTARALALSLEAEPDNDHQPALSTTVQYEFKSLGGDLNAALNLIAARACSITRGTGAAVALAHEQGMICRAVAGSGAPPLGTEVNASAGFTGECIRQCRPLRCDDAESDPRVDTEVCRHFEIASIVASPILYEREVVGLLEVFSSSPFAFDDGDLAVVERLAQTVVLTLSRAEALHRE
jgi:GAF domain-containing protein